MDQERTYKWIQDRIRELHSGTISESDRVRLEDIAREDPFLQDALEGYRGTTQHDHSLQLKTLSYRILNKATAKRRKLIPSLNQLMLQAVAASLILILVTWAVFYYVGKENTSVFVASDVVQTPPASPTPTIAEQPEMSTDNSIATGETVIEKEQDVPGLRANAEAKAKEYLSTKEKVESPPASTYEDAISSSEVRKEETSSTSEPTVIQPSAGSELKNADSRVVADQDVAIQESLSEKDEGYYANQMHPAMMASRVTGQVLDPFGQPITGAQVSIANTNLTTITDLYGQFELFLPEKISPVEVYATGYKDTILQITQGTENYIVILTPQDQAYSYSSTSGKEMQPEKAAVFNTKKNSAINYLSYLSSASKFPVQSDFNPVAKHVTVRFAISAAGRPEEIKVIKSNTGKEYEAEAMRLIDRGPDWTCEKRYPCYKEYTIFFR